MWIKIFNAFTKITAWPVQWLCFRTKVLYEDKAVQDRRIKGSAVIVSNHTSVFDYAVYLFVFWTRTLRVQMAEVLFSRKGLGLFLRQMGGIYVDRNVADGAFIHESCTILEKGGVVGVFPESRIPQPEEERPLPFKESFAYIALATHAPIIPVYTNGSYFCKKRAVVIIGKPIDPACVEDTDTADEEKIAALTRICRERVIELGALLREKSR